MIFIKNWIQNQFFFYRKYFRFRYGTHDAAAEMTAAKLAHQYFFLFEFCTNFMFQDRFRAQI